MFGLAAGIKKNIAIQAAVCFTQTHLVVFLWRRRAMFRTIDVCIAYAMSWAWTWAFGKNRAKG